MQTERGLNKTDADQQSLVSSIWPSYLHTLMENSGLDYFVNSSAMFVRQKDPFIQDLAAELANKLSVKAAAIPDLEGVGPLRSRIGRVIVEFNKTRSIYSQGTRYTEPMFTSFRNPDALFGIPPTSSHRDPRAEIVIETTDEAKRSLCPDLAERYVRRMEWSNRAFRSCTVHVAINLEAETKKAIFTVVIGYWRQPRRVPEIMTVGHLRRMMRTRLLRDETVFRNGNGELVRGTLLLLPQNFIGATSLDQIFVSFLRGTS
ncbi:hypothetical protein IWZ03DRAFT_389025 [Phyllosticta citriasiana]|uniref:Uncharacterized protein n=1 Tax=Phyllosticta citriasiana TaxID=595635 RepID=A0ABR1K8S4_9PEZI